MLWNPARRCCLHLITSCSGCVHRLRPSVPCHQQSVLNPLWPWLTEVCFGLCFSTIFWPSPRLLDSDLNSHSDISLVSSFRSLRFQVKSLSFAFGFDGSLCAGLKCLFPVPHRTCGPCSEVNCCSVLFRWGSHVDGL